jgi:hypothetical protein
VNGHGILHDCRDDKTFPWLRHYSCGETSRAYEAFSVYRELGPSRSLGRAAEQLRPASTPQRLARWSEEWAWRRRADAWDNEQERLRAEQMAEKRREANETIHQLGVSMLVRVGQRLQALNEHEARELSVPDLARLYSEATKGIRLVQGDATSRIEADIPERLQKLIARVTIPLEELSASVPEPTPNGSPNGSGTSREEDEDDDDA